MSEMNIFQKMSAVTAELQTVAKNLTVSTGKNNSYKAVSERDIIDAVKPLEVKHGIYSYPYDREIVDREILESEVVVGDSILKKTTFFSRIKTVYRFVNMDDPEDYLDMVTFAEAITPSFNEFIKSLYSSIGINDFNDSHKLSNPISVNPLSSPILYCLLAKIIWFFNAEISIMFI